MQSYTGRIQAFVNWELVNVAFILTLREQASSISTKLLPPVSYLNHKQDFGSYILISRHDGISPSSQCHTYMLAGGTEPLSIRDQHERRPQTGSVVSTVTGVTQQDLRTDTHTLNSTQTSRDDSF